MLRKANQMKTIEIFEDNGTVLVSSSILAKIVGVSVRQVGTYIKDGMPKNKNSTKNKNLFDVKQSLEWINANIQSKHTFEDDESTNWRAIKEEHEAKKMIETAKIEQLKRQEMEKTLVKKDDTDKAMADLASTMGAMYRNDIKALPVLLENKPHTDIRTELDRHYKDRMETMHKILSKELKSDDKVPLYAFDILFEAIKTRMNE